MRRTATGTNVALALVLALVPVAGWYGFQAGRENPVRPRFPARSMAPPAPTGVLSVRLVLDGFMREDSSPSRDSAGRWETNANSDNISMTAPDLVKSEPVLETRYYKHPPYITRAQARQVLGSVEKVLAASNIEVVRYGDERTNFPNQLGSVVVSRTLFREGGLAVMRLRVAIKEPNPLSFGPDPIAITEDYMGARRGADVWKWSVEQTVRSVGTAAERMKAQRDQRRQAQQPAPPSR